MPPTKLTVDLSNATHEELKDIHNEVLSRLAGRVKNVDLMADGYDRHGSGHSRSGGGSSRLGDELSNPAALAGNVRTPTK